MGRRILVGLALFALLFTFYFTVGHVLGQATGVFDNEWLSIDSHRVARIIGDPTYVASRHRQLAHPLFELLLRPLGVPLSRAFGMDRVTLALNAACAALGILGFLALLRLAGLSRPWAAGWSLLLALSTVHLLYGSLPETFIFSFAGLTLPPLVFLGVRSDRRFAPALAAVTALATGVTVTNFVFGAIWLVVRLWRRPRREQLRHALVFAAVFTALFGGGLLLKRALWADMGPFLGRDLVSAHSYWISIDALRQPAAFFSSRLPYFFVYGVVAPSIVPNPGSPWDKFGLAAGAVPARWIVAVAAYAVLVAGSLFALWRTRLWASRLFAGLAAYLAFNVVLHSFYGTGEPHLYGAHWVFAWLAMLALPFAADREVLPRSSPAFRVLAGSFVATLVLVTLNNLWFLRGIG